MAKQAELSAIAMPVLRRANIFTVPAGRPFLDCLASAILAGALPTPGSTPPSEIDLTGVTLMLPTRRATRALQESFLRVTGGRAMLLPRIIAISEGDEELTLLAGAVGLGSLGTDADGIEPAVSALERRLLLTQLVMAWSDAMRQVAGGFNSDGAPFAAAGASTPAQAALLASELARLMDMVETENASLANLRTLVPDVFSEHWQKTLQFLEIITAHWPAILATRGATSPALRRNKVILAEAERLRALPPAGPVIVAGVTGSVPATVQLIRAVIELPNGAVVLPALDTNLDDESWDTVPSHPEHPQFGLRKLLDVLDLTRGDVHELAGAAADDRRTSRQALMSEALRPSATTARWHTFAADARLNWNPATLDGLSLIEAQSAQDEAETIALILREAVETPCRTAALVSPDRLLARRVANRLETWGIRVDDSAGRPFAKTVPGAFMELVISARTSNFAPSDVMGLLKHPLTRLGLDAFAARRAARALELIAFRTTFLGGGLAGIDAAVEAAARDAKSEARQRAHPAVRRLWDEDWAGARQLLRRLAEAFAPLNGLFDSNTAQPVAALARAHQAVAEALARLPQEPGAAEPPPSPLWLNEAGEAAARFFAGLLDEAMPEIRILAPDYADFYRSLIVGENVRPRVPVHPRLSIWGPFEARLQQPDLVVLGSLNDGTWPEAADPGPWLSRPMRAKLGLPSPEEKIGYAAHDFAALLGAPQVVMTRAEKVDGVPTVPSRWLLRLKALLDGIGQSSALKPQTPWLGWALERDRVNRKPPLAVPEPRPAVDMRPRKLSVSRIETWIANPYAIFAREILGLQPLDPLGMDPGAAMQGNVIHEALSRFSKAYPDALPADTEKLLVALSEEILGEYAAHARIAAFWMPRFARFAAWFAASEPERRRGVARVVAETSGSLVFAAPGGPFTLTARADRIDMTDNGLVITDYKTNRIPADKLVADGFAPQLPLEAAIAMGLEQKSGFEHVPPGAVSAIRYIRASGGEPPGEERPVRNINVAAIAASTLDGLKRHVAAFDDPTTPYRPLRRARFSYDYDGYAHLARVAEWSAETGEGEPDGEGASS